MPLTRLNAITQLANIPIANSLATGYLANSLNPIYNVPGGGVQDLQIILNNESSVNPQTVQIVVLNQLSGLQTQVLQSSLDAPNGKATIEIKGLSQGDQILGSSSNSSSTKYLITGLTR
jgi:hypothetical protein